MQLLSSNLNHMFTSRQSTWQHDSYQSIAPAPPPLGSAPRILSAKKQGLIVNIFRSNDFKTPEHEHYRKAVRPVIRVGPVGKHGTHIEPRPGRPRAARHSCPSSCPHRALPRRPMALINLLSQPRGPDQAVYAHTVTVKAPAPSLSSSTLSPRC